LCEMASKSPVNRASVACGIQRISIGGGAQAYRPRQRRGQLNGVLRVEIHVQEVEGLGIGHGVSGSGGGCDAVDVLRQVGVGDGGNGAFAEVVIVQTEDADVVPKRSSCFPKVQARLSLMKNRAARGPEPMYCRGPRGL